MPAMRADLVASLALAGVVGVGCKSEIEVTLDVQIADGIADVVDLDNDLKNLTVNGVGRDFAQTVPFPGDGPLGLELLLLGGGNVVTGHGRVVVDEPPAALADYAGFRTTMILGKDDAAVELESLPPNLGAGSCATSDEAGRVFVVGGADAGQSGYGLDDDFRVRGLDDVDALRDSAVGCSARGGRVVAGACNGDAVVDLGFGDTVRVDLPLGRFSTCGAFAATSGDDYFLVSEAEIVLVDSAGVDRGSIDVTGFNAAIASVEPVANGNLLVRLVNNEIHRVVREPLAVSQVGVGTALGRRFDEVVAVDGERLLVGEELQVANGDLGLDGVATAVTVLSNDTVAAVVDGDLVVVGNDADGAPQTTRVALRRNRARLAALPGDTILLLGDEGVDVVVLGSHAPRF